ncbi:MAG: thiamine phosphate synthase [Ruminococcus sp.]|nr:thiamine phosphate synthase [Ruminococcus sp.]
MLNKNRCLLYAITDRTWLNGRTLEDVVEQSLMGGADIIQLREKNLEFNTFLDTAIKIKRLTEKYRVPLIINDNIEVCIQSNADGVHIGQGDIPLVKARKILGKNKIIGVTAKTIQQSKEAQLNGADYIGVGAMFGSTTKKDALPLTFEQLSDIRKSVTIPIVAIGGITADNIHKFKGTGVDGIAVVSAIFKQSDIKSATEMLLDKISEL